MITGSLTFRCIANATTMMAPSSNAAGKVTAGTKLPGLPEFARMNHWHAWVDRCLGREATLHGAFRDAIRMTEATQLAVKATRFPGVELQWDKSTLSFPNHAEASRTIVRRTYRAGFAPPKFT